MSSLNNEEKITEIVYYYRDATVPPQYHRSYTINCNKDSIDIIVNSYGKILARKIYQIDSLKFDSIITCIEKYEISNCKLDQNTRCTGGTSETIKLYDEYREIFSGSIYHCGGQDFGDLCGDTKSFAFELKKYITDIDSLLR